jgi:hypothetical protein
MKIKDSAPIGSGFSFIVIDRDDNRGQVETQRGRATLYEILECRWISYHNTKLVVKHGKLDALNLLACGNYSQRMDSDVFPCLV